MRTSKAIIEGKTVYYRTTKYKEGKFIDTTNQGILIKIFRNNGEWSGLVQNELGFTTVNLHNLKRNAHDIK